MKSSTRTATSPTASEDAVASVSLRDEHRRITQERLVAAAEKLFMAQGFRATTVEQIVKAAGTTPPTFYRYFNKKSDLAHVVSRQLSVEVLAVLQKLADIRKPTRKSISGWVNEYYAMWLRTHALCGAFWEAAGADATVAAQIMPDTLALTSSLDELLQRFPPSQRERIKLRLALFVLAADRIAFLADAQKEEEATSRILAEYADILWETVFRAD